MDMPVTVIKQHLIDPEICIRCNTCETMCPVGAISHDSRNYVVDASKCNWCNACISPCPTGSIDNYRRMPAARAYTLEEQLSWDTLPAELPPEELKALAGDEAELVGEAADVLFHLMVLLAEKGVKLEQVLAELDRREGVSGITEKASRSE